MTNQDIYKASKSAILDIVSRYVQLKKKGTNYWACCPFHNEKSPSFSVSERKGKYICYGCGASGDGVTFFEQIEQITHREALQKVADFLNLGEIDTNYTPLPKPPPPPIVTLPLDKIISKYKTDYSNPCNFVAGLQKKFDRQTVQTVCKDFFVGQFGQKTIFFEAENNRVFYGQIMGYNLDTLKRIKKGNFSDVLSFGTHLLKEYPDNKTILDFNAYHSRRLFGSHLIADFSEIRIVESQKTAIIANIANYKKYAAKEVLYVGTGGSAHFNPDYFPEKFVSLKDKKVVIIADSDSNEKDVKIWASKALHLDAKEVLIDTYFIDSCTPEEKAQKYDLADKILSFL